MSGEREPLVVVVRVTEACNLSCSFCAYDRRLSRSRASADPEQVVAFARALAEHGRRTGRRVLLSFLGGEPLLWPALPEVEAKLLGLGLELSVTTNGTTLGSKRVCRRLLERYLEVTVSVDGLHGVHDALRGWPGGFDRLKQSILRLAAARRQRGHGPLLRVNSVLLADNVERFGELCLELATWGIDEVTFNQLGGNDRPEFYAGQRLSERHVERLRAELPRLREALSARGVRLRGAAGYLERFAASARGQRLPIADCKPGERFLFVSESGEVAPCSFTLSEQGLSVAGVELCELPARFRTVQRARRPRACDDCPSTQVFSKFAE